ncbi:LacI family DNA-binding transcriptional regulator [Tepidibacter hydrothermalis]|uniref:LacI family DNA-binding transcriptional regulator n=1 Tax=Tepidibacter hydrothermalis TaxID=3036126 RepID=A0ABY8E8F7_9FIRM|nr:LacI family DNA-binding transcriptional regulator [Tepidibacter hydrothermalis]WFD09176.1 LacI family DNA-binding transcriptional regulator [Tepidibacter hydrothermalis]
MSNIRKIAKAAGVSIATVSRYLNGTEHVSDEVKLKIQKVIEEVNYKPNALARAVFTKNSKTIGLMVPNISNPFFNQMSSVIEENANNNGYNILLCNTDDDIEKEKKYLDVLQSHRVAGIVVARSKCKEEYGNIDIPIISFENHISDEIITVSSDNYSGGKIAFEHLYESGCRRILHIKGPKCFEATEERYRGFLDAAKEKNLEIDFIEFETDFQVEMLKENIEKLKRINKYDGIFVFNDIAAATVMKFLKMNNTKIPKDIQIIGFDNSFICELLHPSLTTINQPIQELGKATIEILIKLINNEKIPIKDYLMEVKLINRGTTIL